MNPQKIIIICGPTAVGKTGLGIELAQKFNGEIVCADSQQVYRGMDIGTAKHVGDMLRRCVSPEDIIKHHLVDICGPDEHFDVSTFKEAADWAIIDITGRGKIPFVVGGTGMYIKILCFGLCEAPPQDEDIRKTLNDRIKKEGMESLYDELKNNDPVVAEKLHQNDKTRIIRALEVMQITGESISKFQSKHIFKDKKYDYLKIGLNIDRDILYKKINERVDDMIKNGWLDEVQGLLKKYPRDAQAFKAVGYEELALYLDGKLGMDEAIERIKTRTRQFAKRQLTWFKADKEINWFEPKDVLQIERVVQNFL